MHISTAGLQGLGCGGGECDCGGTCGGCGGHGGGMGQADSCPSVEQMMGISDPSDPCQAANYLGTPLYGAAGTGTGSGPAANAGAVPATSNMTNVLLLGGALLAVMLIAKR